MKAIVTFVLYVLLMLLIASPLMLITTVLVDSYAGAPFPVGLAIGACLFDSLIAVWLIKVLRSTRKTAVKSASGAKEQLRHQGAAHTIQSKRQPLQPRRIRPELCGFALRVVEAEPTGKPSDSYAN